MIFKLKNKYTIKTAMEAAEQLDVKASDVSENVKIVLEKRIWRISKLPVEILNVIVKNAENSTDDFICELCDFQNSRKSGLTVHMFKLRKLLNQ